VKSRTTKRFPDAFEALPAEVQEQAREAYRLFLQDPQHPSLRFKRVHPSRPVYSARINLDYRALGIRDNDEIIWFWIGSHADYDRMISNV
jgi:hypothetical protein